MNFDSINKLDVNYSHKRTGSKNSLLDFNENEYKPFKHSLSTGKLAVADKKYGHSRTSSKSSITSKLVGKRMGSFSRPIKINDRGSSLQKNNLDIHTHVHKQSHGNLRMPSNEFLIQTRESSLLYSSSNGNTPNSSFTSSSNIPYSSSRDNLNYLYHYPKPSPTSSPRDVNKQLPIYRNNSAKIPASHYVKNNMTNPYSPTSPSSHSPIRSLSRDNYYQKESYNKYNFLAAAASKEKIFKSSLRNKKMKLWTPNDVLVWLTENNLDNFKEIFKIMKIDGKALMEQNYETLIDIADVSILDKYNIISKRDAVLQFEKDNEMIHNNDNNENNNNIINNNSNVNNNNNNPQYTQPIQRHNTNKLLVPTTNEVNHLNHAMNHNITKSKSFESLTMNKENEIPLKNDNVLFTLPRRPPMDIEELNFSKITSLTRTSSLKIKQLMKDEGINQKPVITPRSSSRNIEKAKLRRIGVHDNKVKTPTSSGSKTTTPLKDKHFLFNFSSSPNSVKEQSQFEVSSGYSPVKTSEPNGYDGYDDMKLKEDMKLTHSSSISYLKNPKSITNPNSPIPKFLIKVCNTSRTQSHTLDITNYTSEIKIWERILSKFDVRLTKDNMENYSLSLVKNGIKVPLTVTDIMNMMKVNESNTMVELVLENNIRIKPMEIRPSIKNRQNNININNITKNINKNLPNNNNLRLTSIPPKDGHRFKSNIRPDNRMVKPEIKIERFSRRFADRPPSQLICDRLELFFPDVNKEKSEKIKSIVMENIKEKRLSKLSRISQNRSSYLSYESMLENVSEEYENEDDVPLKELLFKKSNYPSYPVKSPQMNYYQKSPIPAHIEDSHSHDGSISSPDRVKKLSIGDKRNSRKLSIITSPDKLKEYKTNKNKFIVQDIINDYEVNSNASNDDIYTNEITDYSSEMSSIDLNYLNDINNDEPSKTQNNNENIQNVVSGNESENVGNNDERNKRRGQFINIGPENSNGNRNSESVIRDYERIFYGNRKESMDARNKINILLANKNLHLNNQNINNNNKLNNVHSDDNKDKSYEDDAITPKPTDKLVNESKKDRRAIKGISVLSINGGKSINIMNAKNKLSPPETRFSILLPQKPIQWTRGPLIGQGSFSKVYHGLNTETGEIMAVKQVELCLPMSGENDEKNQQMKEALYHEIKLLKELNHENIVRYLGFELTETSSNVFLEYVSGGSVSSLIAKIGKFEEPLVKSLTSQITAGMEYLHNRSIIHRDIKGANILVDEDGVAKISDFGISKKNEYEMAYKYNSRMSFQGSVFWMAPEVIRGKGYSAKVDIWSLGCVVLEMFTGVHPWKQYDEIQTVMYNLGMMNKPYMPKRLNPESQNFLNLCLDVNPEKRPTAKQLLAHSFCKPPEIPFDFKEYYQNAIEKVNKCDISTFSNDMTSNSEMTSYDDVTELYNDDIITEEEGEEEEERVEEKGKKEKEKEKEEIEEEDNFSTLEESIPLNRREKKEEEEVSYENIIPEELKLGQKEEEEEEEVSYENIIPKELKLFNFIEDSDPEYDHKESQEENKYEDERGTIHRKIDSHKEDDHDSNAINNYIDHFTTESIDSYTATNDNTVDPNEITTMNNILTNGNGNISSNKQYTFNGNYSSYNFSLSNSSLSSLSSPLSSLSSSDDSNDSSDMNTLFTTNSNNTKSYVGSYNGSYTGSTPTTKRHFKLMKEEEEQRVRKEEKKEEETIDVEEEKLRKMNRPLIINTKGYHNFINTKSPSIHSSNSLTYKISNLSLSRESEESRTSPALLTPRTPITPRTPGTPNTPKQFI